MKYPVGGKTGTTNDFTDAWFLGFSPSITCGVYVGFDDHRTLGPKEEGARVALPIWLDFMEQVVKDRPVEDFPHSPLLTSPEQVNEILADATPERLLAPAASASVTPAAGKEAAPPAAKPTAPVVDTPKLPATPPAAPAPPPAKSVASVSGRS